MCTWALILNGGAGHWRRKREGLTTRGGWFSPLPFSATTAKRIIQPALPTPLPMPRLLQRSLSLTLNRTLALEFLTTCKCLQLQELLYISK
jgi:hypothetical protein